MAVAGDQAGSGETPEQPTAVPTHAPAVYPQQMSQGQLQKTARLDEGRYLLALTAEHPAALGMRQDRTPAGADDRG